MKKLLTAIAAFTIIAAPAQATTTNQSKEALSLSKKTLELIKAGDYKTACTTYKKYYDLRVSSGDTVFETVKGSEKLKGLTVKLNGMKAKLNKLSNEHGPWICGKAGMAWGRAALPEAPAGGSSVSANIRTRCEREWGTNYRMVRYCVDQQTKAARSLGY